MNFSNKKQIDLCKEIFKSKLKIVPEQKDNYVNIFFNILQQHSNQKDPQEKYQQVVYALIINADFLSSFSPEQLYFMDDLELCKTTHIHDRENNYTTQLQQLQHMLHEEEKCDTTEDKYAPILLCRACKSSNVVWQGKQLKSADEPMTIFCKCESCGANWKIV